MVIASISLVDEKFYSKIFLGWDRRCLSVCVFMFGLTLFVFAYLYFLWEFFWLYMEASSSVSGSRTGARTCRVGVRLALALVLHLQLQLALVLNPPWDDHLRNLPRPCPQPLQPGWRRSELWNINSLQTKSTCPKGKISISIRTQRFYAVYCTEIYF